MATNGYAPEGASAPPPSYASVGQGGAAAPAQYGQPQAQGQTMQAMDANGNPIQVVVLPPGQSPPAGATVMQGMPPTQQMGVQGVQVAQVQYTQGPGTNTVATTGGAPGTTQVTTTVAYTQTVVDDPQCIYVLACVGFFIPLVGFIGMCAYNCGNGLPPKQAEAFKIMCIATILGLILNIIYVVVS